MNFFFVAGFDFGTSYSKVVLQDQLTGIQKVVSFGEEFGPLFPSCLRVGEGWVSGPEGDYDGLMVSYPKLIAADASSGRAMFQSVTPQNYKTAANYLGIDDAPLFAKAILTRYFLSVIQGIHDFIEEDEDWKIFDPSQDPLVVQLAVPTGLLQKGDKETESLMQTSLMAATSLHDRTYESSDYSYAPDIVKAIEHLDTLASEESEQLRDRCITYPEVAAGVQSILQSRSVKDGKYITLDVGAGTIDLNIFNRWTRVKEHRTLDYWACEVKPLGIARLKLRTNQSGRKEHETTVNPISERKLMTQLKNSVTALVKEAFRYQPYETAGDGPSPWKHETYAYIWGGGSEHPAYAAHFLEALREFGIGVHVINQLPKPNNDIQIPPDVKFGRLAIAFGLSYYILNLKEIRLPLSLKTYSELYGIDSVRPGQRKSGPSLAQYVDCTCLGNPACYKCDGSGHIKIKR